MVTSSTSSPSEKEIKCDLRPASVLIFQRQGDEGAGGQLSTVMMGKAGSFQGGVSVVDRRLFVDDYGRLQYTRTSQLLDVIC